MSPRVTSRTAPRIVPLVAFLLVGAGCAPPDAFAAASAGRASEARVATPSPAVPASCGVPVCRYQGTAWAEDSLGNDVVDRGEARVVWRFSHMSGREAVYVPAGSVTASWRSGRCAIALAPASDTFTAASPSVRQSRLHVDFTVRPVRYSGVGTSEWAGTQTWRCPGDAPFTQDGVTTTWFRVHETTSDDPGRLRGTVSSGPTRSGWEFTNSP